MLTLRLALGLLVLSATVALLGPLWEAGQRGPELSVRAYLTAVEREDLTAALEAIAPEVRPAAEDRIANQLGNQYRVDVVALGTPSLLARALGARDTRAQATVLALVEPHVGTPWKTTSVVELVWRDDRWYLLEPPFA